jgi:hypothetical protein
MVDTIYAGKGLQATVAIQKGTEILRESALMICPLGHAASSEEEAQDMHRETVTGLYDKLSAAKKASFEALSCAQMYVDEDEGEVTPHGIYQTNGLRLRGDDKELGGVFPGFSRLNHSCQPNVSHVWRTDLQKVLVFATRDIAAGDELFTTYGPSEILDTAGRREFLGTQFGFDCLCSMCAAGNSEGGDDRMRKMSELTAEMFELLKEKKFKEAQGNIEACILLLHEQGIGFGAYTRSLYRYGAQVAEHGLKDKRQAKAWMERELEAVVMSEGAGCPGAVTLQAAIAKLRVK